MTVHWEPDLPAIVRSGQGIEVVLGDKVVQARAGSYVVKPRGQWHTYWNAGGGELRLMELLVPGGFEACLERLSRALALGDAADVATVQIIGAEYGVQFDFGSVDDICRHFGISLTHWPVFRPDRAGERHAQNDSVPRAR